MIHFLGDIKVLHPTQLKEASSFLSELIEKKESFYIYGGGTDLVPYFKNYSANCSTVVSLNRIESLKEIHLISGNNAEIGPEIEVGSQVKLAELIKNPLIQKHLKGLAEAAAVVASPQIRNQASVGGNLLVNNRCRFFNQSPLNRSYHDSCYKAGGEVCHVVKNAKRGDPILCRARFVSDLAPVLLTLDAKLKLHTPGPKAFERFLPLKDFYLTDGIQRNQLSIGEILASVHIPLEPQRQVAYEKLRIRKAIDFPSLGVALGSLGEGSKKRWQLALTGVQTHPIFVSEIDFYKPKDGPVTQNAIQDRIAELSALAVKKTQPLKQDFLSPTYRKKMVPVLAQRALEALWISKM